MEYSYRMLEDYQTFLRFTCVDIALFVLIYVFVKYT